VVSAGVKNQGQRRRCFLQHHDTKAVSHRGGVHLKAAAPYTGLGNMSNILSEAPQLPAARVIAVPVGLIEGRVLIETQRSGISHLQRREGVLSLLVSHGGRNGCE
jgi:hypothetical protein